MTKGVRPSRVGDQLQLTLGDVVVRVPWDGRSPRDLTRACLSGIFKPQGEKSVSEFGGIIQYDLFGAPREEGRTLYEGAVPLLPLPRGI